MDTSPLTHNPPSNPTCANCQFADSATHRFAGAPVCAVCYASLDLNERVVRLLAEAEGLAQTASLRLLRMSDAEFARFTDGFGAHLKAVTKSLDATKKALHDTYVDRLVSAVLA